MHDITPLISVAPITSILFYLVIFIGIPVLIGVYVYRDATQRGMNATLWTVVAIFAPTFIGLIIYLLVRGSYPNLNCPSCSAPVMNQYMACPNCGVKLKASCPNCGFPLDAGWTTCPSCASPLPEFANDYTPPVKKKDTALWKILIILISIPVLLIVLWLVLMGIFGYGNF